jgi:PAS domain S-box-containing protein
MWAKLTNWRGQVPITRATLTPRAFQNWGSKLGFGNRVEIQAWQCAGYGLKAANYTFKSKTAFFERGINWLEGRIQKLEVSPYRFSEEFNSAIESTAKFYNRAFVLIALFPSYMTIADNFFHKAYLSFHDILIAGLPTILTLGIGHFMKEARIDGLMSEHKAQEAEAKLKEALMSYEVLFELAPIGIQRLDENGIIVKVNQKWLETLGHKREDVIGKSIFEFVYEDENSKGHIENARARFRARMKDEPRPKREGPRLLRKVDGTPFSARTKDTVLRGEDGKPIGVITAVEDITLFEQLMEAEQLTKALQSLIGLTDFLGQIMFVILSGAYTINASTELSNIYALKKSLEELSGFAGLLSQEFTEATIDKDFLSGKAKEIELKINELFAILSFHPAGEINDIVIEMDRAYKRAMEVFKVLRRIRDTLYISKDKLSKTTINNVLDKTRANLEEKIGPALMEKIEIGPAQDIPPILVYEEWIIRALVSLLQSSANAISKKEGGFVRLKVRKYSKRIKITITDNGERAESPEVVLNRIPFDFDGRTPLYEEFLGIVAAKHYINAHEGTTIGSQTKENGETTISVWFPFKVDE